MPEQLLFLLLFVLISVLNAVFKKGGFLEKMKEAGEARREAEPPPKLPFPHAPDTGELHPHQSPLVPASPPPQRPTTLSSEEVRVRKFLEALGLPSDVMPPTQPPRLPRHTGTAPRRQHQTTPAPQPRLASSQPPARRGIDPPPRRDYAPTMPTLAPKKSELSEAEQSALERLERGIQSPFDVRPAAASATRKTHPAVGGTIGVRDLLASPRNLRSAFVIREILGTPAGLRDPIM